MIHEARISDFKCFRSLHLPELSRVNLVGGANNVGKTALLEALFLFHDRLAADLFLKHLRGRGLEAVRLDPESVWAPYFYDLEMSRPFKIALRTDEGERRATYRYRPPSSLESANGGGPPSAEASGSTSAGPGASGFLEIMYAEPDGAQFQVCCRMENERAQLDVRFLETRPGPAFLIPARVRPSAAEEAARLSILKETKKDKVVEEFLRIMVSELSDLQVSAAMPRPAIYCDIGLPRLVPIAYAGDGLSRLLSIILDMAHASGGLVLIDEVENGIHYAVQERFWRALGEAAERLDCQIVATTHSHECLRAAHAAFSGLFEPNFRYIRLESGEKDIEAKTFTHQMLGTALEAHLEVR